jgi:DNA recombination protein RmuC
LDKSVSDGLISTQKTVIRQHEETGKIITEITEKLKNLESTNQRVVDVSNDLKTLQNIMLNPKQRGGVGEYFLYTVLDNVLPPGSWEEQYKISEGNVVDAVVLIDGKILPVDAKFSLENYNRFVEAEGAERLSLEKLVRSDLKVRIDETSKYIQPENDTMDFAFMYIPSEALYYDLVINKVGSGGVTDRSLIEYAFVDRHVIIVGPTTFTAYLQTVLQGLRAMRIESDAKDIQKRVGELGKHLNSYEDNLTKLGKHLGTAVGAYNTAYREFGKVDKDIVRISDGERFSEPLTLERPVSE